jgi:alkanesulfonate monooxygenase SsuD/methylene tetrahydromethanopterin reductase-like flavin-dependent oxidoreductase (luciferase family)
VEGCAKAQRPADPAQWRVAKSIFVTDDDDALAKRYAHTAEGPYHFYFKQLIRKLVGFGGRANLFKDDESIADDQITPDRVSSQLVIAGSVNKVVDEILAFREQVGDFGTLLYAGHDWLDPKLAKRSMTLMAEKVMPAVNAAIGAT